MSSQFTRSLVIQTSHQQVFFCCLVYS